MIPSRPARRPLFLLAACCAALAAAVPASPAASAPVAAAPVDPAARLLRLPDLGPGYVVKERGTSGFNRSCLPLPPAIRGLPPLFGPLRYRGCSLSFKRSWTLPGAVPGPDGVESLAFVFDDPARAQTALRRAPRLIARIFRPGRNEYRVVAPPPQVGEQAIQLRGGDTILGFRISMCAVVWRSGSVLGLVVAVSVDGDADADAQAAVRLAALQQARIVAPTPLRPPVNDDRFVPLDDPTLGAPVMWLGEHLPEHGRRRALLLRSTNDKLELGRRPHGLVRLVYGTVPETVEVELWRPHALRRSLRAPLRDGHCRRRLAGGGLTGVRSWVVATFVREDGRCPHRGGHYEAVAFFRAVAVTIDASGCCRRHPARAYAYDSLAGLRTLLRALRPRSLSSP